MKAFKFFIMAAIVAVAGNLTSCTDYQDEIDALDGRVQKIEDMVSTMQKHLDALTSLVDGVANNWYITGYMPIIENNETVGYMINMCKDTFDPVTGKVILAERQEKTIEVRNGEKGEDAQFPDIEPRQNPDGGWYWVVILPDGTEQPLTDNNGNDIIVATDGKDAVSPQVRINPDNGEWETSFDGGNTWVSTGVVAAGEKGDQGPKGNTGPKGDDADSAIVSITIVEDGDGMKLRFVTKGGTVFELPFIQL